MWEYIRNSFFDAKPYFQVLGQKPDYNQNQFGATFGGPIIKDRTFFFGSWQSLRSVDEAPQLATVPTLAQRDGDLHAPRYTIPTRPSRIPTDPDTCARLSPTTRFPPATGTRVAAQLLPLYPLPNLTGARTFSPTRPSGLQTTNTTSGWTTGSTTKTPSSRAIRGPRARTFCPRRCRRRRAMPSDVWPDARSVAASETHIFRANLINELRFGYMETREIQQVPGINEDAQFGITGRARLSGSSRFADFRHQRPEHAGHHRSRHAAAGRHRVG